MQLAFYLADKWRNPTIVLTNAIVGQTAEVLEGKTLDFGPLPEEAYLHQVNNANYGITDGQLAPTTLIGRAELRKEA